MNQEISVKSFISFILLIRNIRFIEIILVSLVLFSSGITSAQNQKPMPRADFGIDSSSKPIFCFKPEYYSGYQYHFGFYHSCDIKISGNRFLEDMVFSSDSLRKFSSHKICRYLRDSLGVYWVCLIVEDSMNNKDTLCKRLNNNFRIGVKHRMEVFSPGKIGSGDSVNTYCFHTGKAKKYNLNIFDRWGNMVFQSESPLKCWDGKSIKNGENCPDGTYYYLLKYTLEGSYNEETINGNIRIIH